MVVSFREKKANGCSLPFAAFWDSTAPTPTSEASTSTMNGRAGSAWQRMGAVVKRCFRTLKALEGGIALPSLCSDGSSDGAESLDKLPIEVGEP